MPIWRRLFTLPPDIEPRATAHIAEIIAIIERLMARGHAYAAEGHVLFAVNSDPQYGKFSGHAPEDLIAGARVDVAPYKREPGDFVLWKPSTDDLPGWDSPLGTRPAGLAYRMLGDELETSWRELRYSWRWR